MRRLCLAAATLVTVACGSDQSTNNNTPPPLTAAQLALHFDTLAGALQASSPGDIRLVWYQDIASILARGVSPSGISAHVAGGLTFLYAVAEIDAFADTVNGKVADSAYRLAAWEPPESPVGFIDVRVLFLPAGAGKADTTVTLVGVYPDTLGDAKIDSTEDSGLLVLGNKGACDLTPLQHLTVPTNPCSKVALDWAISNGTFLLTINPPAQISAAHLTH